MKDVLTRRELLAVAAALSLGAPLLRATPAGARDALFGGVPFDDEALARCASLYFTQRPAERDRAFLEARVLGLASDGAGRRALGQAIRARVEEDFGEDRLVTLDGWTLSETEVRLFCLAWLARA